MQFEVFSSAQKLIAVTNTAVPLATTNLVGSYIVKALAGNGSTIYCGGSDVTSSNGFELSAGESVSVDGKDMAFFYINGTATQGVSILIKK
jgi:hypothetical protein